MKTKLRNLCKRVAMTGFFLYASVVMPLLYTREHRRGQLRYLSDEDFATWKGAMRALLWEHFCSNYGFNQRSLFAAFAKANIQVIRKRAPGDPENPMVVLCVKNDRRRIQMLVEHYRQLGVQHFAFLDNGSTDGTYEYLLAQPDVDLFTTADPYGTYVKEAWINRIISHYGFDRWYILTDSDELVAYTGMEMHPLTDVTRYARKAGVTRIKALTLDMYARDALFAGTSADIRETYCWMDSDSYITREKQVGWKTITDFAGGPRMRTMGVAPSLLKCPLVYFPRGTVSAYAHFQYPYREIQGAPCYFVIRHYKFLEEDKKEYALRAGKGSGFAFHGKYYRLYLEEAQKAGSTFMYEGSIRFDGSRSLQQLPLVQHIDWEEQ